jgi:GrpB-like predicted nucleotidyltransferase (UPF0157 family)
MTREMIIVPYDKKWPKLYEDEKTLLTGIFGALILDVQHIGSTSIEGMWAKPIIDIMIVVDNIEAVDEFSGKMEASGYSAKGENGIPGRRYFQKLNPDKSGNHTHHVHIYQKWNRHVQDELMFRDFLKIDKEAFTEYLNVKKSASEKYRSSPVEYQDAKTPCITRIMAKAEAYFAE